jgi:ketosteroid isomerase-like protein
MSQENVELVRRSYEAFERGDLEEARKSVDPEMVIYRWELDAATYHGWEGLIGALAEWAEGFDEFTVTGFGPHQGAGP